MSWIVQNLWNNRERIKTESKVNETIGYSYAIVYGEEFPIDDDLTGYDDPFIESEEFNDLLIVEKAVDELEELGLLSPNDLEILNDSKDNYRTKAQKETYARRLTYICERIAYYLGGYFTDEGYINYLTKKYKLTLEQQEAAREYMKSRFKNKTLNKGYRIENTNDKLTVISVEV